jgi:1,4-dihydroxy-2-naphthoate octaprenyltransferase
MTGRVSPLALAAAIPVGCLVTAILVVNNLRDIATDRAAGKRTLAVRLGAEATRWEFALLVAVAYVMPPAMWLTGLASARTLLTWATLPVAVLLIRRLWTAGGRALNPVLAATARLCLWFAVALSAGLIL